MTITDDRPATFAVAPGSTVVVRDEEWLVTSVEAAADGWFVNVIGLSELVRDTEAVFSTALDDVEIQDPAAAALVADHSAGYRQSRLWLEATLRKTAVPLTDPSLSVATQGLFDPLPYQLSAVHQALDADNLRPRILLADAVGLGKTLEIGMILAELVRRGRGDRILVVTPRHVLEQMQFELWTRFALPFVRLDSLGIQRIRQQLPANRNPFAYYRRAIISIDTLKSDRYQAHLEKQRWDAVVLDESHNVTNSLTQNNRLARLLSTQADALILASATPHNGRPESFAELIAMLEPSAVTPDGELREDEVKRLVIRRHRHSPEVAGVVGGDWAERREPVHILVPAGPAENELAAELEHTWLYPASGRNPYAGTHATLFPWTLAKAFLSSPAALRASIAERITRLGATPSSAQQREAVALNTLDRLAVQAEQDGPAKYAALLDHLRSIGVGPAGGERAVVFAERIATLRWLKASVQRDLQLREDQVVVLHGGLSDVDQQQIVESFKQAASPIRVLITGDVASEGVNLHLQCHQLVHFDIPWSLIRIEQRNGRIDRYGQRHRPQITTLLLDVDSERFAGDVRVLRRLVEKEHEAHRSLGDSASLMGRYDVAAEEEAIREVLAGDRALDEVVRTVEQVRTGGGIEALLADLFGAEAPSAPAPADPVVAADTSGLYDSDLAFLRDVLEEVFLTPGDPAPNGVGWAEHPGHAIAALTPPPDLRQRLQVLPRSYLRDRSVADRIVLATSLAKGKTELSNALADELMSSWPEAHFLSPLHPVLDWASDQVLARLGRNQVFALQGPVEEPSFVLHGVLTNARGQVVSSSFLLVTFPNPDRPEFALAEPCASAGEVFRRVGLSRVSVNRGGLADPGAYEKFVRPGVAAARRVLDEVVAAAEQETRRRVHAWSERAERWDDDAAALIQRRDLRQRRGAVDVERRLAAAMLPRQRLVRPLLFVLPGGEGQ